MNSSKILSSRWIARAGLYAALAGFGWLMLEITLQYWPIQDDVAFLQIKQDYLDIAAWKLAFFIHVFTSPLALLAGFTQFAPSLLRRWPGVHRAMGRLYVGNVCLITGPASLIMAFYANGGPIARVAFVTLSVLWLTTTFLAYRRVRQRRWEEHRAWMVRSYALTLSAITLRSWKYAIFFFFEPPPMDVYRLVAWLGFVPNLLLAEFLLRSPRNGPPRPEFSHRQTQPDTEGT